MKFISFFLPHFPEAPRGERPLLPRRADALWEGPVMFGRNRESRTREAAGRRNWPEAVPRKIRGRKRRLTELSENREEGHTCTKRAARTMRRRVYGRLREYSGEIKQHEMVVGAGGEARLPRVSL